MVNHQIQSDTQLAPVTLFVYNRPWHARQTIEALAKNIFAEATDLIIFSDGPRTQADNNAVREVRSYLKTIQGFKSITINESQQNQGLGKAIISGVSSVVETYGSVIVLEDDLVTSPYFLSFMNQALTIYKDDESVICINAYFYPVGEMLPQTFFIRGADCQGWATWNRGWKIFNSDGGALLHELKSRKLIREFNYDNSYSFSRILDYQQRGLVNSWAIRWYASAFLLNKLTLYPAQSLLKNVGFDNSGSNSSDWDRKRYETEIFAEPIDLKRIDVSENKHARTVLARYFKRTQKPFLRKVKDKILSLLK